jgi:hypothetical protein
MALKNDGYPGHIDSHQRKTDYPVPHNHPRLVFRANDTQLDRFEEKHKKSDKHTKSQGNLQAVSQGKVSWKRLI